jgi:hypothetical protein
VITCRQRHGQRLTPPAWLRLLGGELIELREHSVGGAMHVHPVRRHAHLAPLGGKRLVLIEQDDTRSLSDLG